MLDDIWTTRRWIVGAASFAVVALALVVGVTLAGDEEDGTAASTIAPAAASLDDAPEQATGAGNRSDGDHSGSGDGSCEASGGSCGAAGPARDRSQPTAGTETVETADPEGEAAAEGELSAGQQARAEQSMAPNVNPDHYGPGGEPQPQPSQPTVEGSPASLDSEPNHNPSH